MSKCAYNDRRTRWNMDMIYYLPNSYKFTLVNTYVSCDVLLKSLTI